MDIYEFAAKMEKDGEALYRQLADDARNPGLKRILTALANDEVKHYHIVVQMRESAPSPVRPTDILANARNVFEQMRGKDIDLTGTQVELYRQAQDIERKSKQFYVDAAQQVADSTQKELLAKIADEEARHFFLLDHVIEFLNRPRTWIEDAEFTHLDEY